MVLSQHRAPCVMTVPDPTSPPPTLDRSASSLRIFILNLLLGGCAGYFKLGQKQKAWTALVLFVALIVPTWCGGSLLLSLLTAIDGLLQSNQRRAGFAIGQWTFFNSHR